MGTQTTLRGLRAGTDSQGNLRAPAACLEGRGYSVK
jgi:hypothetical protein